MAPRPHLVVLHKNQVRPEVVPQNRGSGNLVENDGRQDQGVVSRVKFEAAPDDEPPPMDFAGRLVVPEEQAGNQKTTEAEKEVHACPPEPGQYRMPGQV